MREAQIDVSGQEIMTLDKVTLRMNALVTYVIKDTRAVLFQHLEMFDSPCTARYSWSCEPSLEVVSSIAF